MTRRRQTGSPATLDGVLADGTEASSPFLDGQLGPHMAAYVAIARAERARASGAAATEAWMAAQTAVDVLNRAWPQAYVRYRLAEAILTDHGSRTEAARILADASERSRAMGAELLQADIERLAKRSRIDLPTEPEPTGSPEASRPMMAKVTSESRRASARSSCSVAAGMTNRRIGETLFISESTAGVHVSNILGKLGVSTRAEAAAVAARLGLDVDEMLVPTQPA